MWLELALLVVLLIYFLYTFIFSNGSPPAFWKKYGIRHIDSTVVASNLRILLGKKGIMHRDDYAYNMMGSSDKFCGMLETPSPVILLKDIDLIKKVTIKDFDHFINRRDFIPIPNPEKNIMSDNVGMLKGDKWKGVRSSISPTFTSGKIRQMMEHFNGVSQEWIAMLHKKCEKDAETVIDVLNIATQFVVEVIATSVFGLHSGSIGNPQAEFCRMASRLSEPGFIDALKLNMGTRYPKLFLALGIDVFDQKAINFFVSILRQSLEARKEGSLKRNDFQQLMIETQRGELKAAEANQEYSTTVDGEAKERFVTDNVIVANSLLFFIAGLQSTSAFLSFCMYVLAANPEIQERLEQEVDSIMNNDGTVDYDELGKLEYLEKFMCEVLRRYPLAIRVERECVKEYRDPESGLYVPKGATVAVPIHAIHHDPKYYPEPERFDPERFSQAIKSERSPYAFMPFGLGPRGCLGMRFAVIESKTAIAHLVHGFRIEPTKKTPLPVQGIPAGLLLFTPPNLELKIIQRKNL